MKPISAPPKDLMMSFQIAAVSFNLRSTPYEELAHYKTYNVGDLLDLQLGTSAFQRALQCGSADLFQKMHTLDRPPELSEDPYMRQQLEKKFLNITQRSSSSFPPALSATLTDLQLLFDPVNQSPIVVIYPGTKTVLDSEELADHFIRVTKYPVVTQEIPPDHPVTQFRPKTPFTDWITSRSERPPYVVYPLNPITSQLSQTFTLPPKSTDRFASWYRYDIYDSTKGLGLQRC